MGEKAIFPQVFNLVNEFFKGDEQKTMCWLIMPNTLLGGVAPFDMLVCGRGEKLLKFVKQQLDMNVLP